MNADKQFKEKQNRHFHLRSSAVPKKYIKIKPYFTSATSPLFLKYRTLLLSCMVRSPTRSPLPVAGLNRATLDTWIGASRSMIPPVTPLLGFGLVWRLIMFTFSTNTRLSSSTRRTVPCLPLSRPASTATLSPFLILRIGNNLQIISETTDEHG